MVTFRSFLGSCMYMILLLGLTVHVQAQDVQQPATQHYQNGVELFQRGLFEKAKDELGRFISSHDDHELIPSAKFYRARALAKTDSLNTAHYFESFISEYPHSDFTPKLFSELARYAEEEGDFRKAISYYQRSINHGLPDGQAARTYYRMAEAAVSDSSMIEARSYFLTLADEYPRSEWAPRALYSRGRLYLSESKYDSSTVAFETLRERYPNNEMTRRIGTALGESYYQQGKYEQAIEAFKNAMPHLDEELREKAVYLIAESYNYLNQFEEASTYYREYINRTKGTDKVRVAHYGLGWVYNKQEIYHWAAREFERAAQGDDEIARKALYYKAVNEKLGSRYPEAIETFRTFGERYEEGLWVEEAYYEWAITAYEMGNYSEAIEVLLPLVRRDEKLDWEGKVYTLLGEAYFANKEYTRSLQAFEAAEQVSNIDPETKRQARFQKAWVQYSNQAYRQAQPIFESLHKEAPQSKLGREALFWSADAYYSYEHFGPASEQFAEFVRRYPDHELVGPAYYALGWSYFKMGNYGRAVEPFKTFLTEYEPPEVALYPYDTDTRLRIGDSYYAMGEYDNAIAYYEKAVGAEPGGDYAMFQIANSHYRAEETYEAVTTFRKFLRIYPYSSLREQAQYNIAYIYLNTGNYTQAVEEFKTVINKYPNTSWAARAQYNIGDAYYNAGEYDEAIEAYREVMDKYPKSDYIIEAVNGIQYAQMSAGKGDSSSDVLEEFLAENPQASTADRLRFRQAENLMQSGDYNGAIKEFEQYIRITNNEQLLPDAHFNLADAYEQTNRINEAVEHYQTVVEDYPSSERAAASYVALGRIAYERGNHKQSYSYYEKLYNSSNRQQLPALIGMGNALLEMNEFDRAEEQYEKALERNRNHDPARVGLAKVALAKKNYSEAEDLLNLIAESNTTEVGAEAQYLLGRSKHEQQEYEEAIKAYSNVNILYSAFENWVAKALLGRARCYIQTGNRGDAINTLNTIVEQYPDTPEAREAQKLLDTRQ